MNASSESIQNTDEDDYKRAEYSVDPLLDSITHLVYETKSLRESNISRSSSVS